MKITYQQLEKNFDEIFAQVEQGKTFIIEYGGKELALMPYKSYQDVIDEIDKLYVEDNNEAP